MSSVHEQYFVALSRAAILHFFVQSFDEFLSLLLDCKFYEDRVHVLFYLLLNSQKLVKMAQEIFVKRVFEEKTGE